MTDDEQNAPAEPPERPTGEDAQHPAREPAVVIASVLGLLLVVAGVTFFVLRDGDGAAGPTPTGTATATQTATHPPSPSESSPSPSTSTSAPAVDATTAAWPTAAGGVRYTDPVAAASGFATDYVGFTDPVVGEFQQGDSRSGEVDVRASADGAVTTVFVRQLGPDDTWWVLGSATADILVEAPQALDVISSPVSVSGQARAFEGTVEVEVREDDTEEPLGTGFVTGSGGAELGPFSGSVAFEAPTQQNGALVFLERSAEDGSVWQVAVLRVALTPGG